MQTRSDGDDGEGVGVPVGDGEYTVQEGECVESIAFARGLAWKAIWGDSRNSAVKQARQDPNVLLPGDRLHVPDPESKWIEGTTDQRHEFVRQDVPSRVHIRIVEWIESDQPDEGEAQVRPRAELPYVLEVDGKSSSGSTDPDGWIDRVISPGAREGKLILEPGTERAYEIRLALGGLDPVDAESGVCQRLVNLGFASGPGLASDSTAFQDAIRAFQAANGLESTGVVDSPTRDRLKSVHGS